MTIEQLRAQLSWLLDQLSAVHEAYSSSGVQQTGPNGETQGEWIWKLGDRIASNRIALKCREEIAAANEPEPVVP